MVNHSCLNNVFNLLIPKDKNELIISTIKNGGVLRLLNCRSMSCETESNNKLNLNTTNVARFALKTSFYNGDKIVLNQPFLTLLWITDI